MNDLPINSVNSQEALLQSASNAFKDARRGLMEGAQYLFQIDQENAWELHYSSFGEFVEQECQISRSSASKLLQTYKFYVIDHGVSPAKIENIDTEKLYAALRLEGDVEKKLAMAETLSRSEIRNELKDPDDSCLHEHTYTICRACHKRV